MTSKHKQLKKKKRQKDYKKKRNMIRNMARQDIVRGMSLVAGRGLIPASKKFHDKKPEATDDSDLVVLQTEIPTLDFINREIDRV